MRIVGLMLLLAFTIQFPIDCRKEVFASELDNLSTSAQLAGGDTQMGTPSPASDVQASPSDSQWITWHIDGLFSPCDNNCGSAVFAGQSVLTSLLHHPQLPLTWDYGNASLIANAFERRAATLWNVIDVDPEFGIGKRFGGMTAVETWGAIYFRWTDFPWNDFVKTTVALATGIDVASKIDREERDLDTAQRGSLVLHYFSPEFTFALPDHDNYQVLLRLNHRSGIFGLINGVGEGAQFLTIGFRLWY